MWKASLYQFSVIVTQLGVGIELEVGTDEVLSLGQGVHQVTQTAVFLVQEVLVGVGVAVGHGVTGIQVLVVQHLVVHLIVLTGVGDDVVLGDQTGVHAPAAVELHRSVPALTLLGGDDHHAVGTAVTVNGRCGGVLQHGHGLDVLGVDVGNGTIVRHAVHNVQGRVGGTDGTDTADADGGSAAGRITTGGGHLHTGGGTRQGAGHAGGNLLFDGFGSDLGGRTGKRTLGGRTIGDHDGLVQNVAVILQDNVQRGLSIDGNDPRGVTQAADIQTSVPGNRESEST